MCRTGAPGAINVGKWENVVHVYATTARFLAFVHEIIQCADVSRPTAKNIIAIDYITIDNDNDEKTMLTMQLKRTETY